MDSERTSTDVVRGVIGGHSHRDKKRRGQGRYMVEIQRLIGVDSANLIGVYLCSFDSQA